MDVDRIASRSKPLVAAILRSPLHPLLSFGLLLISFEGRRTGRRYVACQFDIAYERGQPKEQWRTIVAEGAVVRVELSS